VGSLVVADIKGKAAGGTLGIARERVTSSAGERPVALSRTSRNTAPADYAHIAGLFLNIRGGTFALSCKQHPHALLGPDAAGDLIISPMPT